MMTKELRPCPFCGEVPQVNRYGVAMHACRILDKELRVPISWWNRRAERTCQIVVSIDRNPASYGGRVHRCSSCGKALPGALFRNGWTQLDYCPRCGARVTEVVRDGN